MTKRDWKFMAGTAALGVLVLGTVKLAFAIAGGAFNVPISAVNAGGGTSTNGGLVLISGIGAPGSAMSGGGFTLTPGPLASAAGARLTAEAAHAYPTPYMPSRGHDKITFSELPARVTIRIYTLTGALVNTLEKNDSTDSLIWRPVTNSQGSALASGVYLFVVAPPSGRAKKGKLMIIK